MPEERTPYTFDRVVRRLISVVVLIGVFVLLRHLSDVLLPFVAAVILAYLLNPLVTALERRTNRRGLAVGITLGGLFIVAAALVAILVPLMFSQVARFRDDVIKLRRDLTLSVSVPVEGSMPSRPEKVEGEAAVKTPFGWQELKTGWAEFRATAASKPRAERIAVFRGHLAGTYLGDFVDRGIEYVGSPKFNDLLFDTAKRVAVGGWTVVTFAVSVVLGLTGLIVVLLYLVFLLLDYPEYARTWPTFLPPSYREPIVRFLEQFDLALRRYFRGQALVALFVGTLFAVGFTLVGLPMAVPFGLFVGLLNMVPYLQTVGIVPAVFLAGLRAIEGDSSFVVSVALTLMIFAVVQLIQEALITPRVMGKATGLRPVAILLGVFVWGKLLGFLGLLLAIPLTCLGIAYYRRFVLLHGAEAAVTEPSHDPPVRAG